MGTIRNELVIVHHWELCKIEKLRDDAIKNFSNITDICESLTVSPIMTSPINSEYTFVINGDCSKVGWDNSEKCHLARVAWCDKHRQDAEAIVIINLGEDGPARIVFDSTNTDYSR